MNKIILIIQREYLSRVKKKSFLIMTFLVPMLIAGMYGLAFWLAFNTDELDEAKNVFVIDESGYFADNLKGSKTINFVLVAQDIEATKEELKKSDNDYLLYIPATDRNNPKGIELFSENQPSLSVIGYIESQIEDQVEHRKLLDKGIAKEALDSLKANVSVNTIRLTEKGEESSSAGASYGIGMIASIFIYMFIFLYGVQVMRGVIEEKTNRIVEVVISSVRPFQLMMGKIIGIALVGLTQFLLWVVLTTTISGFVSSKFGADKMQLANAKTELVVDQNQQSSQDNMEQDALKNMFLALETINFPLIIGTFLFYFLGGYLLYSALFAAIGSAVDNETETQQFMLPVTIPLIFTFIMSTTSIVNAPDSPIAFWLSVIPFTSPVAMMVRIPFGVPLWELALSMVLMVLGFVGTVWVAARIYRTGILMYGKKVSFREIGKWLFYKG